MNDLHFVDMEKDTQRYYSDHGLGLSQYNFAGEIREKYFEKEDSEIKQRISEIDSMSRFEKWVGEKIFKNKADYSTEKIALCELLEYRRYHPEAKEVVEKAKKRNLEMLMETVAHIEGGLLSNA